MKKVISVLLMSIAFAPAHACLDRKHELLTCSHSPGRIESIIREFSGEGDVISGKLKILQVINHYLQAIETKSPQQGRAGLFEANVLLNFIRLFNALSDYADPSALKDILTCIEVLQSQLPVYNEFLIAWSQKADIPPEESILSLRFASQLASFQIYLDGVKTPLQDFLLNSKNKCRTVDVLSLAGYAVRE